MLIIPFRQLSYLLVSSVLCALCAGVVVPTSYAQVLDHAPPYGDCSIAYWSSNRNLDDRSAITSALCFANWRLALGENARLSFNARAQTSDSYLQGRVREGYWEQGVGALSLRIGRQIIAWGRADRINPTDVLSPRDFRLLSGDDDDQRNGIDAIQLRYAVTPAISAILVAARFGAHQLPQGSLPANIGRGSEPHRAEWAAKVDHVGSGLDWSVFVYDGFDRFARFRFALGGAGAQIVRGDYERLKVIGADIASASASWTWRAEFSHARSSLVCETCPQSQRGITRFVAGLDHDLIGTLNMNLQLYGAHRRTSGVIAPIAIPIAVTDGLSRLNNDYAAVEAGMALRISDRLLNDKLKWELSVTRDFKGRSTLWRPRLSYGLNDYFKVSVGADHFGGKQQSYFGSLKKNSLHYIALSAGF